MTDPKRLAAYAAVYFDRGESLTRGRAALEKQFTEILRAVEREGATISVVGIDLIFAEADRGKPKVERRMEEAKRITHALFATAPNEANLVVCALFARSRDHDPRGDEGQRSAQSILIDTMPKRRGS